MCASRRLRCRRLRRAWCSTNHLSVATNCCTTWVTNTSRTTITAIPSTGNAPNGITAVKRERSPINTTAIIVSQRKIIIMTHRTLNCSPIRPSSHFILFDSISLILELCWFRAGSQFAKIMYYEHPRLASWQKLCRMIYMERQKKMSPLIYLICTHILDNEQCRDDGHATPSYLCLSERFLFRFHHIRIRKNQIYLD